MKIATDLKIEFRAIVYTTSGSHVLEYRISPDQDLSYTKEISVFGLFTIKCKKHFKTNWCQPRVFSNYPTAYIYSKESGGPYLPIFIYDKKDIEWYKSNFKTIGEFFDYIDKENDKEESKWREKRNEYLKNNITWY